MNLIIKRMIIEKTKLKLVREALSYGLMFSNSEGETIEFTYLLMDVEAAIAEEKEEMDKAQRKEP